MNGRKIKHRTRMSPPAMQSGLAEKSIGRGRWVEGEGSGEGNYGFALKFSKVPRFVIRWL